jgi:predicted ATPase
MLTRLEVDGFKNLLRFEVDFGPFNCIAGPNGVGKSNIFDAIGFLSLLADNTLTDAALRVRGHPDTTDERDLFWADRGERADSFRIAAEMIVEAKVIDDLGQSVTATSTYLRYEVEIGYEELDLSNGSLGGLFLLSETLHDYSKEEAAERLRFPHTKEFFESVVINKTGSKNDFISTITNDKREIIVHANGNLKKIVPAAKTPRTIVAASGAWASATILAARREMQSWKRLAMEASVIRTPDPLQADPHLTRHGGHLHATLYRVAMTAANYDREPEDVYISVALRLTDLVPAWDLSVDVDPVRRLLTTELLERRFSVNKRPARSLSDGTLRFLTLAVLHEDPEFQGLVCIEEPENGIHPNKVEQLVKLFKEMVVDTTFEPSWEEENPMRQVIIATHSPYLVQLLEEQDVVVAIKAMTKGPTSQATDTIRCLPLPKTWRSKNGEQGNWGSILAYLGAQPNASIKLPASLFDD